MKHRPPPNPRRSALARTRAITPSGYHVPMLSPKDIESLTDFAMHLCRLGGDMALDWVGSRAAETKPDDSPVTQADHAVQAAILDAIARRYPQHAVLVEETLADPE